MRATLGTLLAVAALRLSAQSLPADSPRIRLVMKSVPKAPAKFPMTDAFINLFR